VSVSPPPDDEQQRRRAPGRAADSDSIAGRLGELNLTPPASRFAMGDVAAAIADVARGSDAQTALLEHPSPEPGPDPSRSSSALRRSARRRTGSRNVLTPHDVRDEEPPVDRFHDAEFQQSFGLAKALMASLVEVLASSDLHTEPDSTMRQLHQRAEDLAAFDCPLTRTVGFVGDSGVGKWSCWRASGMTRP
jgi:hypothetical protein